METEKPQNDWAPTRRTHPKVRFNNWFALKVLPKGYAAITVFPFIFVNIDLEKTSEPLLKHELAHFHQITQHGVFWFYFSYTLFYFAGLARWRSHKPAYEGIPFEVEARAVQFEPLTSAEILLLCKDQQGEQWCHNNGKGLKGVT